MILVNIEDAQIFEEATGESNILMVQKGEFKRILQAVALQKDFKGSVSIEKYFIDNKLIINELDKKGWNIGNQIESDLKRKIETDSKLLKDWEININFGIKTGFNEAFIIDEATKNLLCEKDSKSLEVIKPILRGRDLKKYGYTFVNLYMIISKFKDNENFSRNYPTVQNYLSKYEVKLKNRGQVLNGQHHWLELDNNPTDKYFSLFDKPKILWGEISDKAKFSFDETDFYAEATLFIMTGKNLKYILAILNSKVSEWYFAQISTTTGMGTNRWKKYKIEQFPIKQISESAQQPFIQLVEKILSMKQIDPQANTQIFEDEIDNLVFDLYGLSAAERLVVLGG